jgi:hypothetical protein
VILIALFSGVAIELKDIIEGEAGGANVTLIGLLSGVAIELKDIGEAGAGGANVTITGLFSGVATIELKDVAEAEAGDANVTIVGLFSGVAIELKDILSSNPQIPKSAWQPAPQYARVLPATFSSTRYCVLKIC